MIQKFWNEYLDNSGKTAMLRGTICFGDSLEAADSAAQAVLSGAKTAMIYPEKGYHTAMKGMPKAGDLNIAVNWAGEPVCVIETVNVSSFSFAEIPENLRTAEYPGEENWPERKEAECKRELEELGMEFNESVMLVAEEFRAIYRKQA